MHIAILLFPGTWLDDEDQDWTWRTGKLLSDLGGPLADMALSLTLFESARAAMRAPDRQQWAREGEERAALEEEVARELGVSRYDMARDSEIRARATIKHIQAKLARGERPCEYAHRLPFLHARAFLFALDRLDKLLRVIARHPKVRPAVSDSIAAFSCPITRGVRNSVAHYEDRTRGLGRNERPLELQPIKNAMVHADGGVLVLESLNGNRFGSTMENGEYGEDEIGTSTLETARMTVQSVLDGFQWKGAARVVPT
jgi:hypothetical protein